MMTETTRHEITLFVVPGCPLCERARAWLARHEIDFVERNVKNDFGALRRMYKLTRQNLVPVVARGERALVCPADRELAALLLDQS